MRNFTGDELAKLPLDELKRLCINLRGKINKNKRIKKNSFDLEIYFCYVVRELEKRPNVQKK